MLVYGDSQEFMLIWLLTSALQPVDPLYSTNTLGTKIIVLISEVSLFQGVNSMKLGLGQVSWLTKVCLFQGCLYKEVSTVIMYVDDLTMLVNIDKVIQSPAHCTRD